MIVISKADGDVIYKYVLENENVKIIVDYDMVNIDIVVFFLWNCSFGCNFNVRKSMKEYFLWKYG